MITTAVFNQKGGVGKTSLCVNLSASLFRYHHKKVLVMDCDAQNNASEYLMGIGQETGDIPAEPDTIYDYLQGKCSLEDIIYTVKLKDGRKFIDSGVDVIASGTDIDSLEFESLDEYRTEILDKVKDRYDYCFIDCPPQKVATALSAIDAADYILIPIETENDSSFSGYTMAVDLINRFRENRDNETLRILGLVITKTKGSRSALDSYMIDQCRQQFGDALFDTMIRDAQVINDAFMFRDPVVYYRKSSPAASDYRRLAGEFIKRVDDMNGKTGI